MSFFGLGTPELILIAFLLLLFFGREKLPELAKSMGKSFRELKKGMSFSDEKEDDDVPSADTKKRKK